MAERLLALPPCGWRLPVASTLETMLVAKAYLHIMSLKIAEATGGCVSRHATMKKQTIYTSRWRCWMSTTSSTVSRGATHKTLWTR
jgi:hypothetical protein